jgi:hypothetical protein
MPVFAFSEAARLTVSELNDPSCTKLEGYHDPA